MLLENKQDQQILKFLINTLNILLQSYSTNRRYAEYITKANDFNYQNNVKQSKFPEKKPK